MTTHPTAAEIWSPPLPPVDAAGLARPRVGIAGISIESSTFSPHRSGDEAFTIREGAELLGWYPFLGSGDALREAAEWVPVYHGRSLPGGAVEPATYARMRDAIVAGLRAAGPLDGLLLDIHGAMSVVGLDDAEADLADAVREAVGPDVLVSATLDLHGNVSERLVDAVDLITCYRMAPHEDAWNTKERAAHNLLARLRSSTGADPVARRPWKAWVPVPVLLPGEKTSTRLEPARSLYDEVARAASAPGVVDAALWIGYAWADEPRSTASVVVTGDERELVTAEAERIARMLWQVREDFSFVAPAMQLADALELAVDANARRPFVISDSGDNPTAGGTGDVSWTLARLLEHDALTDGSLRCVHASIFDPAAVATAQAAGVGQTVELEVGGRVDATAEPPARLVGRVLSVTEGDPVAGTQVVVQCGGVHAIVTERRKPFHHLDDFLMLGIDPRQLDIVVVKIGYLEPELYELAADWVLALTPGGVDQDLLRLGHRRIGPGTFPFAEDGQPELAARSMRGEERR